MTFKFVTVLCLFGSIAAAAYEYNGPGAPVTTSSSSHEASGDGGNNNLIDAFDTHSHEGSSSSDNVAVPLGYDYSPNPHRSLQAQPFQKQPIQQESYQQPSQQPKQTLKQPQKQSVQQKALPRHTQQEKPHQPLQPQHSFMAYQEPFYHPPAKYDYKYAVHDELTGDIKSHMESRDGDFVRGTYSLVDPDGYRRMVTYTADDVHGFHAVVNREPVFRQVAVVASTVPVPSFSSQFEGAHQQQPVPQRQQHYHQQQDAQ